MYRQYILVEPPVVQHVATANTDRVGLHVPRNPVVGGSYSLRGQSVGVIGVTTGPATRTPATC
ncbi:hypothetical protein ROP_00970 [Rhodococcus opacus B4]|uniref:Uncharacterized protein n=1 Tax=Rhodococcus opacus (strain B4) TaxID=632772 RepID=C1AS95_RHOOB|nr:hypothetical protein ROP_00970 [Rhodococcus opacus B4]